MVSVRPEAVVWAEYDGKVAVTADPRDLDLPLSPEDLLAQCRIRRSASPPARNSFGPASSWGRGGSDPAYDDQMARVTVIVELVHPDDRLWSAVFSPELTLSRHRIFTATHSRR